jgi:hypothetical protein|tara:strand:- start:898 stop:1242 length:345 start_codon:yes stop_codon:yes gene_type:complete
MKKYVKVECVSSFRQTYMIPMDGLQETNPDVKLTDKLAEQWASDIITCEEANEFSQRWLGETISSVDIIDEDHMIRWFDKENPELAQDWDREKKLQYVSKWNAKTEKPGAKNES